MEGGAGAGVGAAAEGVARVAANAQVAAQHAETAATQATQAKEAAARTESTLTEVLRNVTVGDPTTKFELWEQVPAWVMWAAGLALAFYMVSEDYTGDAGWTFAIVSLVVGIILSYRTKFSFHSEKDDGAAEDPGAP